MIRRVWSDLIGFREPRFEPGFNVVLAETVRDSEETESTNGLGKTTLTVSSTFVSAPTWRAKRS